MSAKMYPRVTKSSGGTEASAGEPADVSQV
jgi:hypothetical protein